MRKSILIYFFIIILFLTPILIIYAVQKTQTVYNLITISSSFTESNSVEFDELINISSIFAKSNLFIYKQYITINGVFSLANAKSNTTLDSSPRGSYIYLNSTLHTTPYSEDLNRGISYNISAIEYPIIVSGEDRLHFLYWSDSGTRNHWIVIDGLSNDTYTAYYEIQHYFNVTLGSNENWYVENVNATSSAFYVMNLVSGESRNNLISYTLDGATTSIPRDDTGNYTLIVNMDEYHDLTWNYVTQYYCNSSSSSIAIVTQSGSQTSDNWYDSGTNSTITASTPQTIEGITYSFNYWYWSLGGVIQSNSTTNPYIIIMTNYADFRGYWNSVAVGVDLNVDGNATITLDGVPVITPDSFHFLDGTTHTLIAIGGAIAGGGFATGLFIGIFLLFILIVFIMALGKKRR